MFPSKRELIFILEAFQAISDNIKTADSFGLYGRRQEQVDCARCKFPSVDFQRDSRAGTQRKLNPYTSGIYLISGSSFHRRLTERCTWKVVT